MSATVTTLPPANLFGRPTREICDYCDGEQQGYRETPLLVTDIPNGYVRQALKPRVVELCLHCLEREAEAIDEDWEEEKSVREYVDDQRTGERHYMPVERDDDRERE